MPDVVRDAIIKISLSLGDSEAIKELAIGVADVIKQQLEELKSLAVEIAKIVGLTRDQLDYTKQVAEEYERIDKLIDEAAQHEAEAVAIAKEHAAVKAGGAGGGGILGAVGGELLASATLLKGSIAGLSSVLTTLMAAPAVFDQLVRFKKGIGAEIKGGDEAFESGTFTAPGYKFLTAMGLMDKSSKEKEEDQTAVMQQQIAMTKQYLDMTKAMHAEEIAAQKELIDAFSRDKATIESLIAVEKQRLESTKAEFGLMNSRERDTLAEIAKKIGEKGVGSLSDEELKFARSSSAFAQAISEFAKKNADTQGFEERIAKPLGIGADLELYNKQYAAKVNQINNFTLQIESYEKLAKDIEDKLKPKMDELAFRIMGRLRMDLDELGRKIRNREL